MSRPRAAAVVLWALAPCLLSGCRLEGPAVLSGPAHEEALHAWRNPKPRAATPLVGSGAGGATSPVKPSVAAVPVPPRIPRLIEDEIPVTLQLRGSELGHALLLLAEQGQLNLVLDGDFSERVDVSLPQVSLQSALEMLLLTYGCSVDEVADIVVVRRDDPRGSRSRVFELQSIAVESVQTDLVSLLGAEGSVVANPSRNVLLVTAPSSRLADVASYLAVVDRPERQVLIEARIVEVDRTEMQELGVRIAFHDIAVDDWMATFVSDFLTSSTQVLSTLTDENGNVDAALNALRSLVDLQVLSSPRLIALNKHEALLEIVSEVPYVNATTTTDEGTVGTQTIQEILFKDVGLELRVTPTIQEGGLVSLTVDQTVSEQTGVFLDVPIVDRRTITTSFLVEQGQTIMIGGILRNRQLQQTEGVPMLMDIPWVGRIFRSEMDQLETSELVILMTPWLVEPGPTERPVEAAVQVRLPPPEDVR